MNDESNPHSPKWTKSQTQLINTINEKSSYARTFCYAIYYSLLSEEFFSDLNEAGNPMNYPGYKEWFNKFNKYTKDNKSNESLLTISNNLLVFSGNTAQYVPVVGPVSSVLFASMLTYVTSLGKKKKALREVSEKMIILTMKVSQFDYDKGEIEHEWELITDELQNLQDLYTRSREILFNSASISI
jgi:hypothetical protein